MPLVTRTLKLLAVSSGASLSPQGIQDISQWFKNIFVAPPQQVVINQQVSSTSSNSINLANSQPIAEIIKQEKYEGCLPLGRGRHIALYACLKTVNDGTNQALFYHVDRAKSGLNLKERVKPIEGIIYKNSNLATLKLKDQSSKELPLPPFWMKNWNSKGEVKPEVACKFDLERDKRASYIFTCFEHQVEKGINF